MDKEKCVTGERGIMLCCWEFLWQIGGQLGVQVRGGSLCLGTRQAAQVKKCEAFLCLEFSRIIHLSCHNTCWKTSDCWFKSHYTRKSWFCWISALYTMWLLLPMSVKAFFSPGSFNLNIIMASISGTPTLQGRLPCHLFSRPWHWSEPHPPFHPKGLLPFVSYLQGLGG